MKTVKCLFGVFLIILLHNAKADSEVDFVRINCVPAAKFLSVQFLPVFFSGTSDLKDKSGEASMSARQQGFYQFDTLRQECVLSSNRYQVELHPRPSGDGLCGGLAQADITVKMGERTLFNSVPFGTSCTHSSLQSIVVTEARSRTAPTIVRYCFKADGLSGSEQCKGIVDAYDDFAKKFPVNSGSLDSEKI